jgi:hypothetical protein
MDGDGCPYLDRSDLRSALAGGTVMSFDTLLNKLVEVERQWRDGFWSDAERKYRIAAVWSQFYGELR